MRQVFLFLVLFMGLSWSHANGQILESEASHAAILDHETGDVLWEQNGDVAMIPASMTKLMTARLVFERLRTGELELTDTFVTSENAWRRGGWASGGSTMGLAIGDTPTIEELLRGIIILSGNDACIVVAEGISGTEDAFAREMTALARRMGLESATFLNSTGLDQDGHEISAIDLARLARQTIMDFPEFYSFYAEQSYEWRGISQPNRNPLLGRVEGADGLKTGHLEVSGYGLTASAERDGVRRIVVLNGMASEADRAREAERLMRLAFNSFETRTLTPQTVNLPTLPVYMGEADTVAVTLAEPLCITGYRRGFEDATTEIVFNGPIEAPLDEGQTVATFIVSMPGRDPVSVDVVTAHPIARTGFMGLVLDGLNSLITGGE